MEKKRMPLIEICKSNQAQEVTQLVESGAKVHIPKGLGKEGWTLLEQILPNTPIENIILEDGVILELLTCQGNFPESFKKLTEVIREQLPKDHKKSFGESRWLASQAEEAAQSGRVDYLEIMVNDFGLHMTNVSARYVEDKKTLDFMQEHGAKVAKYSRKAGPT